MVSALLLWLSLASLAAWLFLLCFRGGFWLARPRLDGPPATLDHYPNVVALVPARNEVAVIGECVRRLVRQRYPGQFDIIVIDDHSNDGTAAEARAGAGEASSDQALRVIKARPLASGWTGKPWALSEGLSYAESAGLDPTYYWLTDADIAHDTENLQRLVAQAETKRLDLVSQMVKLLSDGFWAGLLIPAFVFFFQKLYPFAWVNDPAAGTAAAAGGSVLIRGEALEAIGGFTAIKGAIIDDCSLARAVQAGARPGGGRLWLGLTTSSESLRPYHGLGGVWRMVARSAFTQLNYSAVLLVLTLLGMALLYIAPPVIAIAAGMAGLALPMTVSLATWAIMVISFLPILALYRRSAFYAPLLPLAGVLYSLMTVGSAIRYWQGRGGAWKGRTIPSIEK